jgi:two-component system, NtrC family, sensor kinase
VTNSARFQELLQNDDYAKGNLATLLKETAQGRGFDFLYVVGDDGHIIASEYPIVSGSFRWNWPIISSALEGRSRTSIDVFEQAELSEISPPLARRARIEIVPTVGSAPTNLTEEARGLVLQSASALTLPHGRHAALVGGTF